MDCTTWCGHTLLKGKSMDKARMTKYCTAAALAVRTFITGSSNLKLYNAEIEQIGNDLGLRLDDLENLRKTRGSWLGIMVDFLGVPRVEAIFQLIANGDRQPAGWGGAPTNAQKSALNIQKRSEVYNAFKTFAPFWSAGNRNPSWQQVARLTRMDGKQARESLAVRAASNATGNCEETSLLAYLLLTTLPKDKQFENTYKEAKDLTVGWYRGTHFDHAYVIVSNNGYGRDNHDEDAYCICDPWLGQAFDTLGSDLHVDGDNFGNVAQVDPSLPEMKVGTYSFASSGEDLTRIQGVMQVLHSVFLEQLNRA